mgnify:CR=1 FL=1
MYIKLLAGEQRLIQGEIDSVNALLSNIKPSDIPLAKGVDIDQMKQMDEDPLEVVVEIPAGKSKRGWNYTPKSLKDIVDYVMEHTLNGFLGHQKPEDISTEFVPPVTHWIGAEMRGNNAYFRGLIDADAKSLKRWIRTNRIKEVSIFGFPELKKNNVTGEMDVIGYEPLSIDWTPLHRPGMPTKIVGMEMDDLAAGEQLDGTYEKLREDLREAAKVYFNAHGNGHYVWVRSVRYDNNTVIVEHEQPNQPTKLYSIPFTINNDHVTLGEKTEVVEKRVYEPAEPAGEMNNEGGNSVTFQELVEKLKNQIKNGQITYGQVIGEMAITPEILAGEMEEVKAAFEAKNILDQVKEVLGVSGEMNVVEVAKEGKRAIDESRKKNFEDTISKVIEEKVSGEMAQGLVRKMLNVEEGASEEVIAGEIDKILADDFMQKVLSNNYIDKGTGVGSTSQTQNTTGGLTTKRAQI